MGGDAQREDRPGDLEDEPPAAGHPFGSAGAPSIAPTCSTCWRSRCRATIVTLGARCVGVEPDGGVAAARFEDGSEVEADVIIGADGIHSAVRASLFGPDAPRFTGKICYRSVVPVDAVPGGPPPESDNVQWLGPHGTIVLYPVRRDELINVVCHYDDEGYRHESWVTECERSEVLERYSGWHESLLRIFSAGEVWYKWALYDRDPIPQWTRGRVTVLGDAAHPMLPYLGQGACQSIEDGCVLAAALATRPDDPRRRRSRCTSARGVRARARSFSPRASAASATISPRRWRPAGETSRSPCAGASAATRTVAAPPGSRSTTQARRTCSSPEQARARRAVRYPSTMPGGPPRAAINAEKFLPAGVAMLSSSSVVLHWPATLA